MERGAVMNREEAMARAEKWLAEMTVATASCRHELADLLQAVAAESEARVRADERRKCADAAALWSGQAADAIRRSGSTRCGSCDGVTCKLDCPDGPERVKP